MFVWTSIAHMALPLGETGIKELPNEVTLLGAMGADLGSTDGLYLFPGFGVSQDATREQKHEAMRHMADRYSQNPSGFLVYHPAGRQMQMGRWLGIEFITELVQALIAVGLLARARIAGFGSRIGFVTAVGMVAAIATNVPYWNWYGFPTAYTISYISIQMVGFICVGIVAALVLGRSTVVVDAPTS